MKSAPYFEFLLSQRAHSLLYTLWAGSDQHQQNRNYQPSAIELPSAEREASATHQVPAPALARDLAAVCARPQTPRFRAPARVRALRLAEADALRRVRFLGQAQELAPQSAAVCARLMKPRPRGRGRGRGQARLLAEADARQQTPMFLVQGPEQALPLAEADARPQTPRVQLQVQEQGRAPRLDEGDARSSHRFRAGQRGGPSPRPRPRLQVPVRERALRRSAEGGARPRPPRLND
jgi:hypothetical protein